MKTIPVLLLLCSLSWGGRILAQPAEDPYKNAGAAPADNKASKPQLPRQISLQEEVFSLPIQDAFKLLHEHVNDSERHEELRKRVAANTARIERVTILRSLSGQRAVAESIDEYRYATEYQMAQKESEEKSKGAASPVFPANPATPSAFETRNTGDTLEAEMVIGPDGETLNINIVPTRTTLIGQNQMGSEKEILQPLFETQRITTSAEFKAGQPFLLGTFNPPTGTGVREQKEQRIWLVFLTATLPQAGK